MASLHQTNMLIYKAIIYGTKCFMVLVPGEPSRKSERSSGTSCVRIRHRGKCVGKAPRLLLRLLRDHWVVPGSVQHSGHGCCSCKCSGSSFRLSGWFLLPGSARSSCPWLKTFKLFNCAVRQNIFATEDVSCGVHFWQWYFNSNNCGKEYANDLF